MYVFRENINQLIEVICNESIINPIDLDLLSIDVDGMDIYFFDALKYFPKVICIEYNSTSMQESSRL